MPLLPRAHPLFRTRARRIGFYTATLITAGAIFDANNYHVLTRSLRTLKGGAYIVYLYKCTTPKNLDELTELHAEAARTVRDICLSNEGLYIKLGQLISSMNSAVPPIVIEILKVLLDDAPKVERDVIQRILAKELASANDNQLKWLNRHSARLAELEALRLSVKTTARDSSAPIPEVCLYEAIKAHREAGEVAARKEEAGANTNPTTSIDASTSETGASGKRSVPPSLAPYFIEFNEEPVASASIAQVHKAVIRDPSTGEPVTVAVKVLKPAIRTQIWYDITCHDLLTYAIEYLFNIPITHNNAAIDRNLTRESDFYVEAAHTVLLAEALKDRKDIYIPNVYFEYLTDQLMVTEWVDAIKLSESKRVQEEIVKKGIASNRTIMSTIVSAFSEMVFRHGAVNCDPHPANLMIRAHPLHPDTIREQREKNAAAEGSTLLSSSSIATSSSTPLPKADPRVPRHQVVLLDHGLCVTISDTFRYEYALFFRSLLARDTSELTRLVKRWGVADTDLFVTMTLQKPYDSARDGNTGANNQKSSASMFDSQPNRKYTVDELAAMQQMMKQRLSKFLADEELMPKEMLFVGRSFNYLRALNKELGAPVNRLKMTADCAFSELQKVRIESVDDLELWERCDRHTSAYLRERKVLGMDTFATEFAHLKRHLLLQMTLFALEMFQVFTVFYNTVVVPMLVGPLSLVAGGDGASSSSTTTEPPSSSRAVRRENLTKRLRMGTMEDILEAREAQMSEQMWGPSGKAAAETSPSALSSTKIGGGNGSEPHMVPDISIND